MTTQDFSFKGSRAKKVSSHKDGTWAEGRVREWLEQRSQHDQRFAYHRYPDTKAARMNTLPAQPSDYIVTRKTQDIKPRRIIAHVEVKETAQKYRLPKAKIGQYGKLKMFDLAGIPPIVIVYRSEYKDWVMLFAADLCFDHDVVPASFPFGDRPSYRSAGEALATIFYP